MTDLGLENKERLRQGPTDLRIKQLICTRHRPSFLGWKERPAQAQSYSPWSHLYPGVSLQSQGCQDQEHPCSEQVRVSL